jgi:hypothetical protein
MRDALAVDAADARVMRPETAEDIREPLDQLIKGAETDLDITGRRINGHREGIAAATALDEPSVFQSNRRKQVKAAKAVIFR